jgi:hypothetical protein
VIAIDKINAVLRSPLAMAILAMAILAMASLLFDLHPQVFIVNDQIVSDQFNPYRTIICRSLLLWRSLL